jgi:hypothetical protein
MDKLCRMRVEDGQGQAVAAAPVMLNRSVAREPTRRIVLLTKLKRTTLRMGAVTQAFFRRGDELVETDFENVPHDDPMLVPPKLGFRSFERIPHHRARVVLTVFLLAVAAVLVLDRHSLRELPGQTERAVRWLVVEGAQLWGRLKEIVGTIAGHV